MFAGAAHQGAGRAKNEFVETNALVFVSLCCAPLTRPHRSAAHPSGRAYVKESADTRAALEQLVFKQLAKREELHKDLALLAQMIDESRERSLNSDPSEKFEMLVDTKELDRYVAKIRAINLTICDTHARLARLTDARCFCVVGSCAAGAAGDCTCHCGVCETNAAARHMAVTPVSDTEPEEEDEPFQRRRCSPVPAPAFSLSPARPGTRAAIKQFEEPAAEPAPARKAVKRARSVVGSDEMLDYLLSSVPVDAAGARCIEMRHLEAQLLASILVNTDSDVIDATVVSAPSRRARPAFVCVTPIPLEAFTLALSRYVSRYFGSEPVNKVFGGLVMSAILPPDTTFVNAMDQGLGYLASRASVSW